MEKESEKERERESVGREVEGKTHIYIRNVNSSQTHNTLLITAISPKANSVEIVKIAKTFLGGGGGETVAGVANSVC